MFREFREFVTRGNVIDLGVGIVLGAAFTKIVNSFVDDVLMPPLAALVGDVDFSNLFLTLSGGDFKTLAEAKEAGAVTINYGLFLNNLVSFVIIAFAIFLVIRQVNRMKKGQVPDPTVKECPFCMTSIPIGALKCPNCTSPLAAGDLATGSSPVVGP